MDLKLILFGCVNKRDEFFENLGIERIVPYLRNKGYEADYEYLFKDDTTNDLNNKLACDLAGFSFYPNTYDFTCECIKRAKKYGSIVLVGGKYATDNYEELLNNVTDIDAICLGHGELPLLMLLSMMNDGKSFMECVNEIPYFINANKDAKSSKIYVSNINDLPLPDRKKYLNSSKTKELFICDSHGCSGRCTFCSNCQNMKKYSTRTPEDIFIEIKELHTSYGITQFNIMSNSFDDFGKKGKEKIDVFCDMLFNEGLKISLSCYLKGNFLSNEEDEQLLDKMVKAGFSHVFIGVESANNDDLLLYGKQASQMDINKLLVYLKKHSNETLTSYGFIMLNPFSTIDRISKNYTFLSDNKNFSLENYISLLYVYPETKMYKICQEARVLLPDFDSRHPLSYKVIDNAVREIYDFIINTLWPFKNELFNIIDKVRNIYGIRRLMNLHVDIDIRMFDVLDKISRLLMEYFRYIYYTNDLNYCKKIYVEWSKEMSALYKEMDIIFMKYSIEHLRASRIIHM